LIRRAVDTDAASIAQVHVDAWRSTYAGIVAQDYIDRRSLADFTARWLDRLRDTTDSSPTVLVAVDNHDAITGFVSGGRTRDDTVPFDSELYAIYLLKHAQGQGLGRRLVEELARHLLSQGHTSLCVTVLTANPACHFYERLGAVWIREVPHVLGEQTYQASWYGWHDLRRLTKTTEEGYR
jgi:ribosomal protein S18 acetylase RimI-like enzyme